MKRTKPKQPGHPCPDYIHSLPKKLADTLHSKSKDRYTKYDAFHYLMERQAVHTSDQSKNHTRPFTVTITELSVDWGWHRHTVTAFLGKLVALNYLTVDKTPEGFSLLLNDLFLPDR